jgi:hypothetical protein
MWLQKALSTFLQGLPELYFKITPQTRADFRRRIFEILYNEPSNVIKKCLADAIGEIAGSLISDPKTVTNLPQGEEAWPNFVSSKNFFLINLFNLILRSIACSNCLPKKSKF